jgi:hypothetical protein
LGWRPRQSKQSRRKLWMLRVRGLRDDRECRAPSRFWRGAYQLLH